MNTKYRIVIGETGNEQGHIVATSAKTLEGAERALRRELDKYDGDGWGRVEVGDGTQARWQRV